MAKLVLKQSVKAHGPLVFVICKLINFNVLFYCSQVLE